MRIIFYNPHVSCLLGETVYDKLMGLESYKKYGYLTREILQSQGNIYVLYDKQATSILPRWVNYFLPARLELFFWAVLNKISLKQITFVSREEIKKQDVLFCFTFLLFDHQNIPVENLLQIACQKIFHVTHFFQATKQLSEQLHSIKANLLICENNLTKNSAFFRKYFKFYKKSVYTLPFAARTGLLSIVPFENRKPLCLALGTVVDAKKLGVDDEYSEMISFFHTGVVQPFRKELLNSKGLFPKLLDIQVSELLPFMSTTISSRIKSVISHLFRFSEKREYMKFDINKKYNEFQMVVVGEEINNLPGITFVEAMTCGCAYIGLDDPMYADLGMIPGKHYITYDGTLQDLKKKIAYYQKHQIELKKIANNGYQFALRTFSERNVAKTFIMDLQNDLTFMTGKSSFTKKGK